MKQRMSSLRKTSLIAGVFYLLTFVSIPTLALYGAVRAPGYILGSGPDTPVFLGAMLEVIVGLAGIGTAIALYPVIKRQGEARAVGFVASRTLEAAAIFAGATTLLSIVTLRQSGVGAGAGGGVFLPPPKKPLSRSFAVTRPSTVPSALMSGSFLIL